MPRNTPNSWLRFGGNSVLRLPSSACLSGAVRLNHSRQLTSPHPKPAPSAPPPPPPPGWLRSPPLPWPGEAAWGESVCNGGRREQPLRHRPAASSPRREGRAPRGSSPHPDRVGSTGAQTPFLVLGLFTIMLRFRAVGFPGRRLVSLVSPRSLTEIPLF